MTIEPHGTRQFHPGKAEKLGGETFEVYGDPEHGEAAVYTGTQRNRPVGFLSFNEVEGAVDSAFVHPSFQGKGLGRKMYEAAGRPRHSVYLTTRGEAFARGVGGPRPSTQDIQRIPRLDQPAHVKYMLPQFADWIRESPTTKRVQ